VASEKQRQREKKREQPEQSLSAQTSKEAAHFCLLLSSTFLLLSIVMLFLWVILILRAFVTSSLVFAFSADSDLILQLNYWISLRRKIFKISLKSACVFT
jgi:hypothetical protein